MISAQAPTSANSRAYAGGFIGSVKGGTVLLENVSFNGNVQATSFYSKVLAGANNLMDNIKNTITLGDSLVTKPMLQIDYFLQTPATGLAPKLQAFLKSRRHLLT